MASFRIEFKKSAVKELHKISKKDLQKILSKIEQLSVEQRPFGSEKLTAKEQYRIRYGRYRILYSIVEKLQIVCIVKVAHRKEVYRKF